MQQHFDGVVEHLVDRIEHQEAVGMHPSPDVEFHISEGPDARRLVAVGRPRPEGTRWVMILEDADGKPSQFYDFLVAHSLREVIWSRAGEYVAILSRTQSAHNPTGDLAVIATEPAHASLIQGDVTQFTMAPGGRFMVFCRLRRPGEAYGERAIVALDGANGARRVLKVLDYPRMQLGEFGPWSEDGKTLDLTLRDYSSGILGAQDLAAQIDLVDGDLEIR